VPGNKYPSYIKTRVGETKLKAAFYNKEKKKCCQNCFQDAFWKIKEQFQAVEILYPTTSPCYSQCLIAQLI
jgi:hypothetical protein